MWMLVAREPTPDAPYWPGRNCLAAVDATAWPVAWALLLAHAPVPVGLVGPFVYAVALLCGIERVHRALCQNHRYRFTTWRWGRAAVMLILTSVVLKTALVA